MQLFQLQRHLRHLSCIFGRNIDPSLLPPLKLGCKPGLLRLSFSLHTEDDATGMDIATFDLKLKAHLHPHYLCVMQI